METQSASSVSAISAIPISQPKMRTCEDVLREIEDIDRQIKNLQSICLSIHNAPGREHWERGDVNPDLMVRQCQLKNLAERRKRLVQELTRLARAK
jgi:hypothetical protein